MEREILFRGKEIGLNQWIEGDLVTYESEQASIFKRKLSKVGYEASEIIRRVEVVPETVTQYVGLKDSEGKRIFE